MAHSLWKAVPFGEAVDVAQGMAFNKKTNHAMSDTGIPLLRITDLIHGTETKFVDPRLVSKKFIATPTDIIFTRTGQVGLAFRGRTGIVHNNCFRVVPRPGIDPSYLYWFLRQPAFIEEARSAATGSAQPDLSHPSFKNLEFRYPQLEEQCRIAGILSAYDDLIENCQRRIRILEEMARSLYREWFVHFRYPGHESTPLVSHAWGPEEVIAPQGWTVKKLKEACHEMRRNVAKGLLNEPVPYVGLEHIPRRSMALDDWDTTTELGSNKLRFQHGEVLFGKIRPYFHKVSVAPFDGICSADTIVIRPKQREYEALVTALVASDDFVAKSVASSNGSKMPRANWGVLENTPFLVPPDGLVRRFNTLFGGAIREQQIRVRQCHNLRRTRDLLLPKLLEGRD